ncbi:hypothetical protein HYC85_005558 [Camellia sinensis]|uniref:Uncharacterized protein n=1 Tax=Camellia sinensis TaxID=4442 RepID=A0A7J7HZU4_CAMSI|nr:hypothetical protein HYC85_005558 [Camellia sinensis]
MTHYHSLHPTPSRMTRYHDTIVHTTHTALTHQHIITEPNINTKYITPHIQNPINHNLNKLKTLIH